MIQMSSKLYTANDVTEWRALVPLTRSFFGSVEFARISGDQTGYVAHLLMIQAGTARVAIPFFLRPIAGLKFAGALMPSRLNSLDQSC